MGFRNTLEIPVPPDVIMRANARYQQAVAAGRDVINTGIGVVVADSGDIFMPTDVRSAYADIASELSENPIGYQTPRGHVGYLSKLVKLHELGDSSRIASVQTAGGTGALSLAAAVLPTLFDLPSSSQIFSDGGWPNYEAIFSDYNVLQARHLDSEGQYDHQSFLGEIDSADAGSIVLMQSSGFNDDGMDRSPEQWDDIAQIIGRRGLLPIIDCAYSGLTNPALESAADPIGKYLDSEYPHLVTYSSSKNLGLYHNRLGALMVFGGNSSQVAGVQNVLEKAVRRSVSSLPYLPAEAAYRAMYDGSLLTLEQNEMAQTLAARRKRFASVLGGGFKHVSDGNGLFAKILPSGFSEDQHKKVEEQGVIILPSSRVNIGGVPTPKIPSVAEAIKNVL